MQIKLNLVLSLIVEAVKAETFIKGTIDRSAGNDQHASNAVAYNETIGDEEVHERKVLRDIYTSSDMLRTFIQDYLVDTSSSVGSNVVVDISKDTDSIVLTLEANNRFRKYNSDSLARLCSKFIQDQALVLWWTAVGSASQIQYYTTIVNEDTLAIQRLFIKSAPRAVAIPYTSSIKLRSGNGLSERNATTSITIGEEASITYIIDDNVLDDIEVIADSPKVSIKRYNNGTIVLNGLQTGMANITLYSKHDETVYASLKVTVIASDDNDSLYREPHHPPFPHMYPRY